MTTRRKAIRSLIPAIFLAILALLLAQPYNSKAEESADWNEDMLRLLPPEPHLLVMVSSLEELDRQWDEVIQMVNELMGEFGEDGTQIEIDLLVALKAAVPDVMAGVYLDRPVALAMSLPPIMSGQKTSITAVIPVKQDAPDLSALPEDMNILGQKRLGDYLGVYMEEPSDVPGTPHWDDPDRAGSLCLLAASLPGSSISLAVDFQALVAMYQPIIDMGLGMLAMQQSAPAPADSTRSGAGQMPDFSPETITGFADLLRTGLGAVDKLGVGFALRQGTLRKDLLVTPVAGGVLDLGEQPDFGRALELTGLLPPGGSGIFVSAWDPGQIRGLITDFYLLYMNAIAQFVPMFDLDQMGGLLTEYLNLTIDIGQVSATKLFMDDQGYRVSLAAAVADPAAVQSQLDGMIQQLGDLELGYAARPLDAAVAGGSSWHVDFDLEKMMASVAALAPAGSDSAAMSAAELEKVQKMMEPWLPDYHFLALPEALLITTEKGTTNLEAMVQASRQSRRAVDPTAARLAAQAGPNCLSVASLDMASFLDILPLFAAMMDSDNQLPEFGQAEPAMLTSYLTRDAGRFHLRTDIDLAGYLNMLAVMQRTFEPAAKAPDAGQEAND